MGRLIQQQITITMTVKRMVTLEAAAPQAEDRHPRPCPVALGCKEQT